ncbi:hypothetical protein B9Z55_008599 [Caenorhabditis nigoni]|uniref:Helitron helicase-like domain-containing protein n=1 Tax=Caenorhabditis nigoni TaxID=1611254 RepID=A0A2G5UNM8_9PELO|nr:hypothetical protein B9Z55_008599 [Caenorhabditis nigoni]
MNAVNISATCEHCGGKFLKEVLELNGNITFGRKREQENGIDANWLANSHPVFFPNGAAGWHEGLRSVGNVERAVTLQEYMTYISMERENAEFNPIHHGKLLSMQLYLSSWAVFEQSQLDKYRNDQERIRADTRKEMFGIGEIPDTRIILPSSHEGSYRYMTEQFLDSLAIMTKFGKPDFFITFVCNRHWSEIADRSGSADYRPDLIARYSKTQVDRMLNEYILKDKPFGKVEAYVLVYEWQRRGSPHIHVLLTMKEESKPKTSADINRVISVKDLRESDENHEKKAANMEHRYESELHGQSGVRCPLSVVRPFLAVRCPCPLSVEKISVRCPVSVVRRNCRCPSVYQKNLS